MTLRCKLFAVANSCECGWSSAPLLHMLWVSPLLRSSRARQIAVAEQLIDALQLPEDFDSAAISNPTLQRFYEVRLHRAISV